MATKILNIALDERLLQEMDKVVKQNLVSRSEYFYRLALADLSRRNRWETLLNSSNKKGRELGIISEEQI